MYHSTVRLLLASASPRRAELLRAAGFEFDVAPAAIDESLKPGEDARSYVVRLAEAKASAVACRNPGRVVLGADTTVVVDDTILGKPADDQEASEMLARLSGRTHEVLTGIAIGTDGRLTTDLVVSRVRFLHIAPADIAWYVSTGEPLGKAGAYAIQGRAGRFVEWMEGSYTSVMGLPIASVYQVLHRLGFN